MFQTKNIEKIKIYILCSENFFKIENRPIYEIMWANVVQPDRQQIKIQHSACAFHAVYLRLQTHTQNM